MSRKGISIVIPVYNAERHLCRCLESVLAQTLRDIEVVCIDDGSTDSSSFILEKYRAEDSRVRVIREENSGQAAARALGVSESHGDWVTFCDADDWVEPQTCEAMLEAAMREQADCVCCGLVRDRQNGCGIYHPFDPLGPSDTHNCLCSKLFRRELLESIEIATGVTLGEDLMVTAQAMRKARRRTVIEKPLYHYCENATSVTHVQDGRKRVEDLVKVGDILRSAMPEPRYDGFHDRLVRDALLLWIRFRLFDRELWRSMRSRMKGGLTDDPRHGILKKGALFCAGCIFD